MGVDVNLHIKNLQLLYWKSSFDKEILGLFFTDDDLIIDNNSKYNIIEEETYTQYKYSTTIKKAKSRLNSAGYTLKKIEEEFNERKFICIDYSNLLYKYDLYDEEFDKEVNRRIEKYVTFKKWTNSVKKYSQYLLSNDLEYGENFSKIIPSEITPKTECDKLVANSLKNAYATTSYFGCLYHEFNPINTIRIILENCQEEDLLEVDISEMVCWTYNSIEDMRIGDIVEKTIVLVEGTSDKAILEFALKNIYPHLFNLYYFMDFEYAKDKKRQGGTDAISNNVKTFITSKIKGRFIAIFDNDTVGMQAKEKLIFDINSMPNNFRILCYPNIKFANSYPTISTNGKLVFDNINGRACSIELYLPDFLLMQPNKSLPPIHWESYIERKIGDKNLADYQGVVSTKDKIKDMFMVYKKEIETGIKEFNCDDWTKMKILLDEIITAFN